LLSSGQVKSEQLEGISVKLSEMDVNVVATKEVELEEEVVVREEPEEEAGGENELVEAPPQSVPAKSETKEPFERTDDPVRMYLREMGAVKLLSREGEIAIAKRFEAGREAMIAGLCESPLTFQAIIIWRDELNESKVLLRDIIDLDATYAGPDAKAMPAPVISPDGRFVAGSTVSNQTGQPPQMQAPLTPPASAIPSTPVPQPTDDRVMAEHGTTNEPDDDDDMENWLSVAAIEARNSSPR
jgi:RNA polymerase primary sigma factor